MRRQQMLGLRFLFKCSAIKITKQKNMKTIFSKLITIVSAFMLIVTSVSAQLKDTTVVVRHQETFSSDNAETALKRIGAVILEKAPYFSRLTITIARSKIDTITKFPWITAIEEILIGEINNDG